MELELTKEVVQCMYELWKSASGVGSDDPEIEKKNRDEFKNYLVKRLGTSQAMMIITHLS